MATLLVTIGSYMAGILAALGALFIAVGLCLPDSRRMALALSGIISGVAIAAGIITVLAR